MLQFIKFNVVGVLNTLLDILLFTLLIWLGLHKDLSQVLSYGAGMANSYAMNKYWTFAHRTSPARGQIVRFLVLNGCSLLLSLVLLNLLSDRLQLPVLLSKIVATGCTMLLNYAGSKLWVFRVSSDS